MYMLYVYYVKRIELWILRDIRIYLLLNLSHRLLNFGHFDYPENTVL